MVARFDKSEPHVGTFRARLESVWLEADVGVVRAVGINGSGRAVKGPGNSGMKGVVALGMVRNAGHPVDVMSSGEIVGLTGLTAGTNYYAQADGTVSDVSTGVYVGHTVEADRLIVRFDVKGGVV